MYKNYEKILNEKGLTSYQVYKGTGVSQSSLSDWKNGKSVPKIDKMQKIADYLGVDVNYLYGKEEKSRFYGDVEATKKHLDDEPELKELYESIVDNEDLVLMFDSVKDLSPEDMKRILTIIKGIRAERGMD